MEQVERNLSNVLGMGSNVGSNVGNSMGNGIGSMGNRQINSHQIKREIKTINEYMKPINESMQPKTTNEEFKETEMGRALKEALGKRGKIGDIEADIEVEMGQEITEKRETIRSSQRVDPEEYLRIYEQENGIEECMKRYGLSNRIRAIQKAYQFRKRVKSKE